MSTELAYLASSTAIICGLIMIQMGNMIFNTGFLAGIGNRHEGNVAMDLPDD